MRAMDQATAYVATAAKSMAQDLFWPGVFFFGLALAAGGSVALSKARKASGEVTTNLKLYVFDFIAVSPALALLAGAMGNWIETHNAVLLHPSDWARAPAWLTLFAALFAGDCIGYWRHRLEHAPWLWPTHSIHHSVTAMTWTTLARFHPLNRLTTTLIDGAALSLFGFPPWAVIANALARHYYGMFIHMDLPWTYGPLSRVFVSPAMHRWHHVREGPGVGANFATLFSVFDQAFGTYYAPGPCTAPLGVPEPMARGVLGQLLWPFQAMVRSLRRALTPRAYARNP